MAPNSYNEDGLEATEVFILIHILLILTLGTTGNIYVIFRFMLQRKKRSSSFEYLLALLACPDLLSSIFVPCLFIYGTITKYRNWHFGYYGCKIIHLYPMFITLSLGILLLVAYERYKVISNPFQIKRLYKGLISGWLSIIFFVSVLLVTPYALALKLVNDKKHRIHTCTPNNMDLQFFFAIGNAIRDFFATVVLIILGSLTHNAIKKNTLMCLITIKRRLRKAERARRMLMIVVIVFSICVLPLDIFHLILYTCFKAGVKPSAEDYKVILSFNTFLNILQITNSATNVVIYSKMQKSFLKPIRNFRSKTKAAITSSMSSRRRIKTNDFFQEAVFSMTV